MMHASPSSSHTVPTPSASMEVRLALNGIALDYGARRVLPTINLHVHHGDVLVVAGPNGSGKSSLLRIICGLQRPTTGTMLVSLHGTPIPSSHLASYIGWVAPDLHLYRDLTALENLHFFAQVRGVSAPRATLEALLGSVGLAGRGDDMLQTYSSGMAQRLRYAYALLHHPPILLLDEPTVTLDERGAAVVERIVLQQRTRGITIIATNDPRELRFGTYVLRLEGGESGADAAMLP